MKSYVWSLLIFWCILLRLSQSLPRQKRALGHFYSKTWTNATIPYFIDPSFSEEDVFYLKRAMSLYANETCIRFEPYKPDIHPNWLRIDDSKICHSEIGMVNSGQQELQMEKSCRNFGLILHELAHTIGLMHEMMRPDRNQFIRVYNENMQDGTSDGFTIESQHYKLLGTPFDFQSITMYSPYDFSKNGLPVWTKMNSSDLTPIFDSREKDISFWDVKAINTMYQCSNHCSNSHCSHPSFLDKNCTCQSPEAFADRRCFDDPDNLSICKNASLTDICYNKPIVSSTICRKTCGRCFRYGDHGFSTPPIYNCVDHNVQRCQRHKLDGYCFTDTWTKVNCKKSCNKCSTHEDPAIIEFTCKDRHNGDLCEEWASNGQCEANPGFMKSNCALSCGSCVANSTSTKPIAPCRNFSPDSYCDVIAKQNKCDGTTLKVCLGSCGKCGSNYERNEANVSESEIALAHKLTIKKECKDILSDCEHFSKAGHCKTHKESMQYHCNKSCNFCLEDDCTNIDSDHVCDDVKQRGMCKLHAGFASRCKKTCQHCKMVTSTITTSSSCVDTEAKYICSEIVRRNQCGVDLTRTHSCIHSCGLCNTPFATLFPIKNRTHHATSTPTPCVDEDNEEICQSLLNNGWCQAYLDRAVLCRKTCNLCDVATTPTPCQNEEDTTTCLSWAAAGYCTDSKEYMMKKCALACHFCKNSIETSLSCTDVEESSVCESWAKEKHCSINIEFMTEKCRKSCGFCESMQIRFVNLRITIAGARTSTSASTIELSQVSTVCRNVESDDTCRTWKERGFCLDYAEYMQQNCASSCNQCQSPAIDNVIPCTSGTLCQ